MKRVGWVPFIIILILTNACTSSDSSNDDQKADTKVEKKLRPVENFTIPTAKSIPSQEPDSLPDISLHVVSAPDISARKHPVFDLGEKGYDPKKEPIKVQLLNYWDDSSNFFANINFKNTGRQINKSIYIFGYDRLGRLVSTRVNNTFFREQQNLVRTLRFSKRDRAVRWTILVKN